MKKIVLIFLVVLVANAYGQSDFPISNAIWNVQINFGDVLYAAGGDTLINDTTYSKLLIIQDTIIDERISDTYLFGFIRNEGEKVLLKPINVYGDVKEIVLYDFSKTIGDTIWHNASTSGEDNYTVFCADNESEKYISIITNKYIEDGLEKYDVLTGLYNNNGFYENMDTWIRGVGSLRGLLQHLWYPPMCDSFYDNNLMCLKYNDTVKYFNDPRCSKCFCRYDTSEIPNENADESITVYPNPACNSIAIDIEKEYTDLTVEIIDEMGRVIYSRTDLDNPISLDNFVTGIYFVRLQVDGGVTTKKIVVE